MSAVQLLRVSVHERISAAAEDFLLQVEKGGETAHVPTLRALLSERLAAAAEEIVAVFEENMAEYEDRVERSEREVRRQKRLLDAVIKPKVLLHRTGCPADVLQLMVNIEVRPEQQQWSPLVDQKDPEPPHIKEEQEEPSIKQEGEQLQGLEEADIKFTLTPVPVKSEEDDEKPQSSELHQSQTEENRADGGGPEPARNSSPCGHLPPGPEDKTKGSSETEDSDDERMETREPRSGLNTRNNKQPLTDLGCITNEKPFSCSECGYRFRLNHNLKVHMRIHSGVKPFSCSECGKSFTLGSYLKKHMRTHTGEKPFSCSECGQTFGRKGSRNMHMKIHTGEKPFSCAECGKSFYRRGSLSMHMRTHTGEKPFTCSECGKSFSRKTHRNTHMMVHTGAKPFSCPECGKKWGRKEDLKKHMKTHTRKKTLKKH